MAWNNYQRGVLAPPKIITAPTFIALDFETANKDRGSACQIALAKYSNGQLVDTLDTLIKPPSALDRFEFTYLHGIDSETVKNAPTWPEVLPTVTKFVRDYPVFAHNAPFDRGVWLRLDELFGNMTVPPVVYCTVELARKYMPGLTNYKLPTVTAAIPGGFRLNHHNAKSDAIACGNIVAWVASQQTRRVA